MPAIPIVTKEAQRTYVPAVGVAITGGQLVEARTGGRIGPAADGSVVTLGVAVTDAIAPEDLVTDPVLTGGQYVLNAAPRPTNVTVVSNGKEVPVVYAEAAAFGELLAAAANGQVRRFRATDPDGAGALVADPVSAIVGRCTAPAGVTTPGATGLMRVGN